MRQFLALLSLVIVLGSITTTAPTPSKAQAVAAGPTSERPFLKSEPGTEVADELATKAAQGDEKAGETIAAAGLTYVPALQRCNGMGATGARRMSWKQFRDNRGWLEVMLGWELALAKPTPALTTEAYGTLKNRFQNPEAQLARAILNAAQAGDDVTRKKLVDAAPNSVWTKAAEGWISDYLMPKECVERLIAVLPLVLTLRAFDLRVEGADLADVDPTELSQVEWREVEFKEKSGPNVLRSIFACPAQWTAPRLCERIGALCVEAGDPKLIENARTRVQTALGKSRDAGLALKALAIGANPEDPRQSAISPDEWDALARDSCGPALIAYATQVCGKDQPIERTAAAIAAFRLAPDLSCTVRFFLRECLASTDEVCARLAVRGALALRDDMHEVLVAICSELMATKRFKKELEAMRAAMESSKNAKLVTLAKSVKAGDAGKLSKPERAKLGLPLATRAAMMAAFAHADEVKACGGPEGLFWVTQGIFLYGIKKVHAGSRAFWEAIDASIKLRPSDPIHPNIYEYRQVRAEFLGPDELAAEDAAFLVAKPAAAKANALFGKEIVDDSKGYANCALTAAQALSKQGSTVLPDQIEKPLLEQTERWGAQGLCIVADMDLLAGKYARRKDLFERAERIGPLVRRVHYYQTPRKDDPGTYGLANFEVAARSLLRMLLIEPCCNLGWAMCVSVGIRTGQNVLAIESLMRYSGSCCAGIRFEGQELGCLMHVPGTGLAVNQLVHRSRAVFGELWNPSAHKGATDYLVLNPQLPRMFYLLGAFDTISRRPFLTRQTVRHFESRGELWMDNVDHLLDNTIKLWRHAPEKVIEYIGRARKRGISAYGEFVGSQGTIGSLCAAGKFDEALKVYRLHRKSNKLATSLDSFMLAGLLGANRYGYLEQALKLVEELDWPRPLKADEYSLRRATMALGRHETLADMPMIPPPTLTLSTGVVPYTRLFHEARALFESGNFDEIIQRTQPYLKMEAEDGLGVYADAALIKALAMKEAGQAIALGSSEKVLQVLDENFVALFMTTPALLDWHVLQMLAGKEDADSLPVRSGPYYWHGTVYSERPPLTFGSGNASDAELAARDSFVRGVLAYLIDDKPTARRHLEACVKADQRCAYEYHVAEWLLANRLK